MVSIDKSLNRSIIISFSAVAVLLVVLLSIVAVTAVFSRQVQRRPSWYNFVLPIIFYQASFLFFPGPQDDSQRPAALCALQAVLIYTLPVYCATGFASFVLDFYIILKEVFDHDIPPSTTTSRLLLSAPPATFLIVLTVDLVFIFTNQEIKSSLGPDISGLYCRSGTSSTPALIAIFITIPGLCVWFLVYIKTALMLKQHKPDIMKYEKSLRGYMLSIFVRTTLTTFGTCIGLGLGIQAAVTTSKNEKPYHIFLYLGFPLLTLLTFGTQLDFFRCWMCRRRIEPPAAVEAGLSPLYHLVSIP